VEISLRDALLLGGEFSRAGLDDRLLTLPVEAGTEPGDKQTYPGEGMPISKSPGQRGGLVVTFKVRFSKGKLTEAQRKSIAEALPADGE